MAARTVSALALFGAALVWASASMAEGALAVGIPKGDPRNGFRWSLRVNDPDAATEVMKVCRQSKYPASAEACMLINTFSDQCGAVAANGDPNAPVTAAGWAIAPDSATATSRAIAMCETMRRAKGGSGACHLDGDRAVLCDGTAK